MTMSRWDDRGFLITDRLRSARLPSWTFGQLRIAIFARGCARPTGAIRAKKSTRHDHRPQGRTVPSTGPGTSSASALRSAAGRRNRVFAGRPSIGIGRYWPKVQCVTEIHIRPLAVANPTQSPTLYVLRPPPAPTKEVRQWISVAFARIQPTGRHSVQSP